VHYTGRLLDGTKFDSSLDRNEPIEFKLGQGMVIKGWDEGIALLKVGGKALLIIPSNLAYGSRGAGGVIPPFSPLTFEVELVSVQ
jgi:peptidylprolyl isomerase